MNLRLLRHALILIPVMFLVGGQTPHDYSFVSIGFGGRWSSDGRAIVWDSKPNYQFVNSDQLLVMVSFIPESSFDVILKSDPRTLAYFKSQNSGVGRAVLSVRFSSELNALAASAHDNIKSCGGIEVLNSFNADTPLTASLPASPPIIATTVASPSIQNLLSQLSASSIAQSVSQFESLGTRFHGTTTPNRATDMLQTTWQQYLPAGASMTRINHASVALTNQESLIVSIPGQRHPEEVIVIGAHLDSINHRDQTQAPGADDDASGVAALTELLRVIHSSGSTFDRTIELHAYAAEEVGLLGSKHLAAMALTAGRKIYGMMQLDMTGYSATTGDQTIHLITTDTSSVLTRRLKELAVSYLGGGTRYGTLSAGTSDHKSWHSAGFHSVFPFEHPESYNKFLHTDGDRSTRLDTTYIRRFASLAMAFLGHEAGLSSALDAANTEWESQLSTNDKIKFAVSKVNSGSFRISAAIPSELAAESAEFCRVSTSAATGCLALNTDTSAPLPKNGKIFFTSSTDMTLSDGDLWRLSAFSSSGRLVAMRTVKLLKK